MFAPDRFFHDARARLEAVTEGTLRDDRLNWFDKLCLVRFYGAASYNRSCVGFLHARPALVREVCVQLYRGMELVEGMLCDGEINWQSETLVCFLTTFRDDEDLELTARLVGMHTLNMAVAFYANVMDSTLREHETFRAVGESVMQAHVLRRFPFVVKHVMTWFEPGLYLNLLLGAVSHTLGMAGAVEELFAEELSSAVEQRLTLGIDTFKLWGKRDVYPNTVAWFLLHALCHSKEFGSKWCAYILCHVLSGAEEVLANRIVEEFGAELMDLAHTTELARHPITVSVQSVVLEALLRYGKVQHKVFNRSDVYEGTVQDCCLLCCFCCCLLCKFVVQDCCFVCLLCRTVVLLFVVQDCCLLCCFCCCLLCKFVVQDRCLLCRTAAGLLFVVLFAVQDCCLLCCLLCRTCLFAVQDCCLLCCLLCRTVVCCAVCCAGLLFVVLFAVQDCCLLCCLLRGGTVVYCAGLLFVVQDCCL